MRDSIIIIIIIAVVGLLCYSALFINNNTRQSLGGVGPQLVHVLGKHSLVFFLAGARVLDLV